MNFSRQKAHGLPLRGCATGGRAEGIAEFPWLVAEILLGDEVFGDVPVFDVGGEDQLQFGFVFLFLAGVVVGFGEIGLAVMADDFKQLLSAPVMFSYST